MRVKLFSKSNPMAQRGKNTDELELEINIWLEKNPTVEVLNVAQCSSTGGGGGQELIISLWYRDSAETAAVKRSE